MQDSAKKFGIDARDPFVHQAILLHEEYALYIKRLNYARRKNDKPYDSDSSEYSP